LEAILETSSLDFGIVGTVEMLLFETVALCIVVVEMLSEF
jgi:hypothetical protein